MHFRQQHTEKKTREYFYVAKWHQWQLNFLSFPKLWVFRLVFFFFFLENFQQFSMQQFFNNPQHCIYRELSCSHILMFVQTRPPSRQYFSILCACLLLWLTLQTYGLKLMPLSLYVSILYLIFFTFISTLLFHMLEWKFLCERKKTHNFFLDTIPQMFSLMSDTYEFFLQLLACCYCCWMMCFTISQLTLHKKYLSSSLANLYCFFFCWNE